MSAANTEQYYATLTEQYIEAAERLGLLAELCNLRERHPDHGPVEEYWLPNYPQFFEAARALGATAGLATHPLDEVHPSSARGVVTAGADNWQAELEEKLAAALGWECQPRQPNELFHRWKRPSGSMREGRPHWSLDSNEAFKLAAELEIGTSYRTGLAIASFAKAQGGTVHVEEEVANHRDALGAMRTAIARAGLIKAETELRPQMTASNGPNAAV
jgi:hypothetical protein